MTVPSLNLHMLRSARKKALYGLSWCFVYYVSSCSFGLHNYLLA